jgi:single-stranded-DNA-specific exonuclease
VDCLTYYFSISFDSIFHSKDNHLKCIFNFLVMYEDFSKCVKEFVGDFLNVVSEDKRPVKIVGNLDADGITSVSLLAKAFSRKGIKYAVSIIKQINNEFLKSLKNEDYGVIIFVDLGSGYINQINEELDKEVFILDHHFPEIKENKLGKIRQINPHIHGIDGTKQVSAAGVTYFFTKTLDKRNVDLSYLALVGAIGDVQENLGFKGLNEKILEDAVDNGLVEVKETLRVFGMQTKPIHKALEYSTNPYIPGVTGNEKGAIKFIEDAGIKIYDNLKEFRRLVSLTKQELDKLVTAIDLKKGVNSLEPLVGPVFLLKGESDDSLKKDLREFSTLLNSCGKMGWPSLGVGVCMGDVMASKKAYEVLRNYRREIIDALNWFHENRGSDKVVEKEGYVLVIAENNIRDTIIGTLASSLSKSKVYPDGVVIMTSSYTLDGYVKCSLRISGENVNSVDLRIIVKDILDKVGDNDSGYGGGHNLAAGASIPQEKEVLLIKEALTVLEKAVGK